MAVSKEFLKKFASVPWKGALVVLSMSFLLASVISSGIAYIFLPDGGAAATRLAGTQAAGNFAVPGQTTSMSDKEVTALLESSLFDTEESEESGEPIEKPVLAAEDDAVRSSLAVKLMGTIYGGDPYSGIALVENSSKNSINSFMVGDVLTAGAKVIEVLRERIIIMNNDRREYIDVQKKELVRNKRKKQQATAPKQPGLAALATQPPPSSFQEPGFERKGNEMTMSTDYRNKMLNTDFTKVLQDAKATPNMSDEGELRGFKLTRIRQDSIYEKAGLQNDDVVEEVNGVPLNDTAQAIKLLNSLRTASEIEVRVRRNGSVSTMILRIQ